jgi:hypothetical protein
MKLMRVSRYSGGFQVVAESRRGRRYECITDCRGKILRTFREEESKWPGTIYGYMLPSHLHCGWRHLMACGC